VAHLTDNFTSETPLSPAVRESISAALEQGWADPKKQSQAAGRAAILAESAKTEIAAALQASPERLEIVGEPALTHFFALQGFTHGKSPLYTSTVDVGKIRAIARQSGDESLLLGVDETGLLLTEGVKIPKSSIFSLQATNGETGASQNIDSWRDHMATVVVDATHALPEQDLISGFAATSFEATSWNGPQGIGFLNINNSKSYKYPLPHIAPIRVPGSYSLPLLVGSAIALSEYITQVEKLKSLRALLIESMLKIDGVTVLATSSGTNSRYLSILVEGLSSEEVIRTLLKRDLAIDAGSACSPVDLTPSHVIASMGFPTAGHLRFTVQPHHSSADIAKAAETLQQVLGELRS